MSLYYFIIEQYAQLKLIIGEHFYPLEQIGIKFYYLEQKAWVYRSAKEFIYKFWHITPHGSNINKLWTFILYDSLEEIIIVFVIATLLAIIFFTFKGRQAVLKDKVRGSDLIEAKLLAKMLKKSNKASKIRFSGLPLVKDSERKHVLITGTTGSGKTNMLNELLPQIRCKTLHLI
ncbi:type IV secretion system DNA-binding domain-containing protein [Rickettsia amblyommatis]|uniref:type IV secretion system DNA-binding domain-containing protein n=1 Tax=Rickettsia amblyommatis TaxID=33989 RepID=UPI002220B6D9|nr:type IV secretion system DNA-binding domain-containing protein [Rickettsia amblyommatis]